MKLLKKETASILRKKGFSIKEISKELGVAKSSVSLWVRDIKLSAQAKKILEKKLTNGQKRASEVLKMRTIGRLADAKKQAGDVFRDFLPDKSTLKICCALLYVCEGSKVINDSQCKFTNSDPVVVATFLNLLRLSFPLDETKFRVGIHLHDYHNPEIQLQFWSKTTNISILQFIRPYHKPRTGKSHKDGYQGCVQVSYNDVIIARQLQAVAREFLEQYKGL